MTQSLIALREKYQRMLEMRRLHASDTPHEPRPLMRDLATRFPGALREIDELPLPLIELRIEELDQVIDNGLPPMKWMLWMAEYHGHLRAVLRIKRMGLPATDIPSALRLLRSQYVAANDEPPLEFFDADTLLMVLKPRAGRLNPWLLSLIAARHFVQVGDVEATLFPGRLRPS